MRFTLFAIVVVATSLSAQEQRYRFETRVEVVAVDVAVTRDDRPITGLTAEDFEVRDSGVLQEVDRVQVEKAPVNAVFVLDNSESVAGPKLGELRGAVRDFISGLREKDRAALLTFADHVQLRQDLTSDPYLLFPALSTITAWGRTALYDALFAALMLVEPPVDRPIVVLFSDGVDNMSRITEEDIFEAIRVSNAVVYAVRSSPSAEELWDSAPISTSLTSPLSTTLLRRRRIDHDKFLRRVAGESGGRLIRIDDISDMELEFSGILKEIKSRYLLTYSPKGVEAEGWHRLEVKLKNRKGEIRARRGYYVRPPVH